jgi:hypothetical protein
MKIFVIAGGVLLVVAIAIGQLGTILGMPPQVVQGIVTAVLASAIPVMTHLQTLKNERPQTGLRNARDPETHWLLLLAFIFTFLVQEGGTFLGQFMYHLLSNAGIYLSDNTVASNMAYGSVWLFFVGPIDLFGFYKNRSLARKEVHVRACLSSPRPHIGQCLCLRSPLAFRSSYLLNQRCG